MTARPLISLTLRTYNQREFVRETVCSALSQDYSPLEIVISDDASQDGTWDILKEEVERYRSKGGPHQILLHRNEHNLGIALNSQWTNDHANGELIVDLGGDDVCFPNRVSRIVAAWQGNECRALAIYHGAYKIDSRGQRQGQLGEFYFTEGTLGAVAAYSKRLKEVFGPIEEQGAAEDEVYGNRALILGAKLYLRENLLNYRIGVGVSSGRKDYRNRQIRVYRIFKQSSLRQALKDLEHVQGMISAESYQDFHNRFEGLLLDCAYWLDLLEATSLRTRFVAFMALNPRLSTSRRVFAVILLFPKFAGDMLLRLVSLLGL